VKRNEHVEPTEMAGVAEAETEMAYAWGLDYDDPDEFPTVDGRRRRTRSTSIRASRRRVFLTRYMRPWLS